MREQRQGTGLAVHVVDCDRDHVGGDLDAGVPSRPDDHLGEVGVVGRRYQDVATREDGGELGICGAIAVAVRSQSQRHRRRSGGERDHPVEELDAEGIVVDREDLLELVDDQHRRLPGRVLTPARLGRRQRCDRIGSGPAHDGAPPDRGESGDQE